MDHCFAPRTWVAITAAGLGIVVMYADQLSSDQWLALLEVLVGIALAWLGAGETPQPSVLLGHSLVIGALVVNEWLDILQRRTTP